MGLVGVSAAKKSGISGDASSGVMEATGAAAAIGTEKAGISGDASN